MSAEVLESPLAELRSVRLLGGYDGRPFDDRCEEMIFFARRD